MFEIYRMQLRQILGGRMKWLAVTVLLLPVLLTLALVAASAKEEIEREISGVNFTASVLAGDIPETARRMTWEGEDLEFLDGRLRLTKNGLFFRGRELLVGKMLLVNNGYLIVRNGELWVDQSKRDPGGHRHIHIRDLPRRTAPGDPAAPLTLDAICTGYLFLLYPQVICLLLALFYGTSVLGHELSGKTLTYLFTRSLPRWKFVVGKYLGIVSALVVPACLSLLASWLILGGEGGLNAVAALAVGTAGALIAYTAIFIMFGFLVPRRAMIAAILYGVVFELILSFMPALVNRLTVTYYLRSLVADMLEIQIPREASRIIGGATPQASLFALAIITLCALAISSLLAAHKEYLIHDQA